MRYQDWPERLNRILKESQNTPFAWGSHDCCIFAANVILELTGVDHAADIRGTYTTAAEAARMIEERGGIKGIATTALGSEINPKLAQRGDVVLIQTPEYGDTLTICIGHQCAGPGINHIQTRPIVDAIAAWRVQ
jgi:hypothetical protein